MLKLLFIPFLAVFLLVNLLTAGVNSLPDEDARTLWNKVLLLTKKDELDIAEHLCNKIIEEHPGSKYAMTCMFWLAEFHYFNKERDQSLKYYDLVISNYKDDPVVDLAMKYSGWIREEKSGDLDSLRRLYRDMDNYLAGIQDKQFSLCVQFRSEQQVYTPSKMGLKVSYDGSSLLVRPISKTAKGGLFVGGGIAQLYLPGPKTLYSMKFTLPLQLNTMRPFFLLGRADLDRVQLSIGFGKTNSKKPTLPVVLETEEKLGRFHYKVYKDGGKTKYLLSLASITFPNGITEVLFEITMNEDGSFEEVLINSPVGMDKWTIAIRAFNDVEPITEQFGNITEEASIQTEITTKNFPEVLLSAYDYYSSINSSTGHDFLPFDSKEETALILHAIQHAITANYQADPEKWLIAAVERFYQYLEAHLTDIKDPIDRRKTERDLIEAPAKERALSFVQILQSCFTALDQEDEYREEIMARIKSLNERLARITNDISLLLKRGTYFLELEDLESAMADFERVVSIDPSNSFALYKLCSIYFRKARQDKDEELARKATELWKKGDEHNSWDAEAVVEVVKYLRTTNNGYSLKKSIEILEKALEADRYYIPVYTTAAEILSQAGQYERAVDLLTMAKRMINSNTSYEDIWHIYYMMYDLLTRSLQPGRALVELAEFTRLFPSSPDVPAAQFLILQSKLSITNQDKYDIKILRQIDEKESVWLKEIKDQPGQEIDLVNAALRLAQMTDPDMDMEAYLRRFNAMADELEAKIRGVDKPPEIIRRINDYIFFEKKADVLLSRCQDPDESIVLDSINFRHPEQSFITNAIDSMKGNCLAMSTLYLALAQRLNLPVYGMLLPGHIYVMYDDGRYSRNIETTDNGREITTNDYLAQLQDIFPLVTEEELTKEFTGKKYPKRLNTMELIGCILNNRAAFFLQNRFNNFNNNKLLEFAISSLRKSLMFLPNPDGYFKLGVFYHKLSQDTKAFKSWMQAAQMQHPGSMYNIGICYRDGIGTDKNIDAAIEWLEKAESKGYKDATAAIEAIYGTK